MRARTGFTLFLISIFIVSIGFFLFATGLLSSAYTFSLESIYNKRPVFPDALAILPHIATTSAPAPIPPVPSYAQDIGPQSPLQNPPAIVKAVYATSWSAGSVSKMNYLIKLIDETELNAIVIDVKDFSGYIAYASDLPDVRAYHAQEIRIPKINTLVKRLHDKDIYVIARISVFQDPRLALARPDLAVTSSSTGATWKDRKGLAWIDAAAKDAWDYNIAIAKEVLARGFDEVNFDYIRFPSDGDLADAIYPLWNRASSRAKVLKNFWSYMREQLPTARLSADLFGLTAVSQNDLGIGQRIENAFPYFDAVAPMVYPSHYFTGFQGFQKPAAHPYEVVKYSLDSGVARLRKAHADFAAAEASSTIIALLPKPMATFRPWLQDFNLGAVYNAEMVKQEIQAVNDAASGASEFFSGWMLWNPSNVYTREALGGATSD